jgi:hypothetical protein
VTLAGIALATLLAALLVTLWNRQIHFRREAYIRSYPLPHGLFERLRKRRPELTAKDCQLVAQGLRQFFLAHLKSGRRYVSMPSQVVDDLWHEFILYTKNYDRFCRQAFGRFLHHTPAAALGNNRLSNEGLRRCYWFACREEQIDPRKPTRLPLLFAIDGKLNIEDGFRYLPDCAAKRAGSFQDGTRVYCGGDFSDSSIDGCTDGFGDSSGAPGDGGSDGDGGCGGGCGGGGD